MTTVRRFIAGTALSVGVLGCGSTTTSQTSQPASGTGTPAAASSCTPKDSASVCIDSAFAFQPSGLSVTKGTAVTFTNNSTAAHTATGDPSGANPAPFDTGTLQVGDSKTITFTVAGTYQYECSIHNFMKGTVIVTG